MKIKIFKKIIAVLCAATMSVSAISSVGAINFIGNTNDLSQKPKEETSYHTYQDMLNEINKKIKEADGEFLSSFRYLMFSKNLHFRYDDNNNDIIDDDIHQSIFEAKYDEPSAKFTCQRILKLRAVLRSANEQINIKQVSSLHYYLRLIGIIHDMSKKVSNDVFNNNNFTHASEVAKYAEKIIQATWQFNIFPNFLNDNAINSIEKLMNNVNNNVNNNMNNNMNNKNNKNNIENGETSPTKVFYDKWKERDNNINNNINNNMNNNMNSGNFKEDLAEVTGMQSPIFKVGKNNNNNVENQKNPMDINNNFNNNNMNMMNSNFNFMNNNNINNNFNNNFNNNNMMNNMNSNFNFMNNNMNMMNNMNNMNMMNNMSSNFNFMNNNISNMNNNMNSNFNFMNNNISNMNNNMNNNMNMMNNMNNMNMMNNMSSNFNFMNSNMGMMNSNMGMMNNNMGMMNNMNMMNNNNNNNFNNFNNNNFNNNFNNNMNNGMLIEDIKNMLSSMETIRSRIYFQRKYSLCEKIKVILENIKSVNLNVLSTDKISSLYQGLANIKEEMQLILNEAYNNNKYPTTATLKDVYSGLQNLYNKCSMNYNNNM